ncbi:hypothetical protein CEXT_366761 [Caerostris extrusa]|uniref:Uncharacterized protein n=1 Tax=Caerostris extrusa TaxID=172846 RepID=A0AAV4W7N7_CAEEX|nr:hypothetical protein CEXT_366761 [Caerostris extrusa]
MRFLGNGQGIPRDALHEAAGKFKIAETRKPKDAHFEPFEVCRNLLNCAAADDISTRRRDIATSYGCGIMISPLSGTLK